MKALISNQRGSSHIVAVLGVLVIALVAFAGYRVLNTVEPEASSDTAVVSENKIPSKIDSDADVKKAENALNSTAIDSDINPDTLNDDINSLQ